MTAPVVVALSLVSHTNVGKTTLARTLLGRDIGEVRDAPHVTEFADVHTMLKSAEGDELQLWDTPGFGDSVRLMRRLRQSSTPIGWFMSEVWDRWRDRPFWAAQQVVKNIRDEADVLLYLVSAAESPEAAGYVAPEMELLAWTGKPVIVLLNQLGTPDAPTLADDLQRWTRHLAPLAPGAPVLSFDAFARCWVQEIGLLEAIAGKVEGEENRAGVERLIASWRRQRLATLDASVAVLAESLARVAAAHEAVEEPQDLPGRLRSLGAVFGLGGAGKPDPTAKAQQRLAERSAAEVRESTSALIRLHRIEGESEAAVLEAVQIDLHQRVEPGWAAIWGGAVTGALAGLSADVASAGLTLGGGLIGGGILGALGAAGLAHGVNRVRGTDNSWLAWNAEALMAMVDAALLRYLAVAHFGRGRGAWAAASAPAHWAAVVDTALTPHRENLAALWRDRGTPTTEAALEPARAVLQATLGTAVREVLVRLYPDAARVFTAPLPAQARETDERVAGPSP
jgi:hypothetical protein